MGVSIVVAQLLGLLALLTGAAMILRPRLISRARRFHARQPPVLPSRPSRRSRRWGLSVPGRGFFARGGLDLPWSSAYLNLLEFAEASAVPVKWSCRTAVWISDVCVGSGRAWT